MAIWRHAESGSAIEGLAVTAQVLPPSRFAARGFSVLTAAFLRGSSDPAVTRASSSTSGSVATVRMSPKVRKMKCVIWFKRLSLTARLMWP